MLGDGREREKAESMLRDKYPQYAELLNCGATVLKITPHKMTSWGRV